MFGWRKRIGYIAPTVIEVVAYEFYRFAPDGIGLTGVTCSIDDWRPDEFDKALAQVSAAATYLGSRGVDFIIHGGGPLVVARGPGYEEIIVKEVETAGKVKATTSIRAGMEALRHMGARRIAIASPYPKRHNDALTGAYDGERLRHRPRRGHGSALQGDAEPAAGRHRHVRRRRARRRAGLRRALPALSAMAGGANRRRAGAGHPASRWSPTPTPASLSRSGRWA